MDLFTTPHYSKTLETLPKGKEERIKSITEQISYLCSISEKINVVNPQDIERLALDKSVCFITHLPIFQHTYIENNRVNTNSITVMSFLFDSNFFNLLTNERKNGKLFAFYNLEGSIIRGNFLDHCGEYLSSLRDETINEIIN